MNFFGLGGFEVLLIGAVALFVLGPKRLLEGIREARRIYSELKRQRDALQSMITEAIDLEDLKKQIDTDSLTKDVKALANELTDDVKSATDVGGGSVSRTKQLNRPPIAVDPEVRAAIPDLNLSGAAEGGTGDSVETKPGADEVES